MLPLFLYAFHPGQLPLDLILGLNISDCRYFGRVHTCSSREPCARVRLASTRDKNRLAAIGSRRLIKTPCPHCDRNAYGTDLITCHNL